MSSQSFCFLLQFTPPSSFHFNSSFRPPLSVLCMKFDSSANVHLPVTEILSFSFHRLQKPNPFLLDFPVSPRPMTFTQHRVCVESLVAIRPFPPDGNACTSELFCYHLLSSRDCLVVCQGELHCVRPSRNILVTSPLYLPLFASAECRWRQCFGGVSSLIFTMAVPPTDMFYCI